MHPSVDPSSLPINFVAPGRDNKLYIVTNEHKWRIFQSPKASHGRPIGRDASGCQLVERILNPLPPITFPELIFVPAPTEDTRTLFHTDELPVKRPRGRPPKNHVHMHKRATRPPTTYNLFVKQRMQEMAGDLTITASEKMVIIGKEWTQNRYKDRAIYV